MTYLYGCYIFLACVKDSSNTVTKLKSHPNTLYIFRFSISPYSFTPTPRQTMPISRRRTSTARHNLRYSTAARRHALRRTYRRGGSGSNALAPLRTAYNFTNRVSQEVVHALTSVVDGLVDGAGAIVDTTGNLVDLAGTKFDVYATQVFKGAGGLAKQCADGLGTVIRKAPGVGGPIAYVVESVGGGVYHVVVTVGTLTGSAVKRTGKVARKGTDLIVYTLKEGQGAVDETGTTVRELVGRLKV